MWKKLKNTDHFLSFLSQDLEVCVTDYVSIWRVQFSEESFRISLKESNFGLDINESVLIQKGRLMLSNPEGLKSVRLQVDGSSLNVTLAMSFGFPVRLEMKLTEGSKELFYERVTLPLLNTVKNLHTSQQELRELLKKKDLEIEEYKCEGGEIALSHVNSFKVGLRLIIRIGTQQACLVEDITSEKTMRPAARVQGFLKTIPFSDEAHMLKYPVYSEHFGTADVLDCLLSKTVVVPEMQRVKEEPCVSNVKQEQPESNGTSQTINTNTLVKPETAEVKTEVCMKMESEEDIKQEIKSEATETRSPSRLLNRPGVVGPSPSKRNRKKLNL